MSTLLKMIDYAITKRIWGYRLVIPMLIAYWALIFYGTHTPHAHLPMPSMHDKLMHFTAFFGLSFLLAWAIPGELSRSIGIAALGGVGYAIFDELTQLLVKNRSCELLDFLADCMGIICGLLMYLFLRHQLDRRRAKYSVRD